MVVGSGSGDGGSAVTVRGGGGSGASGTSGSGLCAGTCAGGRRREEDKVERERESFNLVPLFYI